MSTLGVNTYLKEGAGWVTLPSDNDFFMPVSRFAREGLLAKSCPSWPGSVNRGEKVVIKLFNGAQ